MWWLCCKLDALLYHNLFGGNKPTDWQFAYTITWWRHQIQTFSALLALCEGIHRSPVDSRHKGLWRGALMLSLICDWINGWANNRDAGDFRRHGAHYDVIVMNGLCHMASRNLSMVQIIACWVSSDKPLPELIPNYYQPLIKSMKYGSDYEHFLPMKSIFQCRLQQRRPLCPL